jgi:hypothetical protein
MHGVKVLVEEVNGVEVDAPFFRDTLPIFASAKLKICFDHWGGPFNVHCHMAIHQDIGMVGGLYKVVKPEQDEITPENTDDDDAEDAAPLAATVVSFFAIIVRSLIAL